MSGYFFKSNKKGSVFYSSEFNLLFYHCMELEKEKLEYDLQHKSQEMANLMINFVRKNEMLTEIKQELFKVMSTLKGEGTRQSKQMLMVVNSKIDSNIQSDEVLKRIEEQFDLIHNNFMAFVRTIKRLL